MKTLSIICAVLLFLPCVACAGTLPDTGQTKCYDNTQEITCPNPGEDFYGQDAQYGPNLQSLTKLDENGNDLPDDAPSWRIMVRDNMTGLIWEVKTDDGSIHDKDNIYIWFDAQDVFIPALNSQNFGGYSDWRLPTVKEFSSLVDSSILYPGPAINTVYFQTSGRLTTPTTGPLRWHQDPTSCPSISSVITYGTYYKRGNLAEAMEAYQNPLAIDPRHALTHNNLGLVYEKQGDFTQAISGYELAIKINLATMESRYNLGNLYESQEMSDKVISRYKELLLVDPS